MKTKFCKLVADFCELKVCFLEKKQAENLGLQVPADFYELKVCFLEKTITVLNICSRSSSTGYGTKSVLRTW